MRLFLTLLCRSGSAVVSLPAGALELTTYYSPLTTCSVLLTYLPAVVPLPAGALELCVDGVHEEELEDYVRQEDSVNDLVAHGHRL